MTTVSIGPFGAGVIASLCSNPYIAQFGLVKGACLHAAVGAGTHVGCVLFGKVLAPDWSEIDSSGAWTRFGVGLVAGCVVGYMGATHAIDKFISPEKKEKPVVSCMQTQKPIRMLAVDNKLYAALPKPQVA